MLPITLVSLVVTPLVTRRNLVRGPLIVAAVAIVAGACGLAALGAGAGAATTWVVAIGVAFGITMGAASSNQLALYAATRSDEIGTASGLLRTAGYFGSIGSSAMIGIVFHAGATAAALDHIALARAVAGCATLIITVADRTLHGTAVAAPA